MKDENIIIVVVMLALALVILTQYIVHSMHIPTVYYSVSQDRCTMVFTENEEWADCSCIDLKNDKYMKIMIK